MIPKYNEFYLPILKVLSNLEKKNINELIDEVVKCVGLSIEDKKETTRSGNQLRYRTNISWALTDLSQGGFIERVGRGIYVLTIEGLELLEENPVNPTRDTLASKSQKFRDFLNRQKSTATTEVSPQNTGSELSGNPNIHEKSKVNDDGMSINADEADSVSLEELYQTLKILKKAKLSTKEIEDKIHQLEDTTLIKQNMCELIPVFNKLCKELRSNESIIVEFRPQKSITIRIGHYYHTMLIETCESNITVSKTNLHSYSTVNKKSNGISKVINPIDATSTSTFENQKKIDNQRNTGEDKIKHAVGVWIKPLTPQTFAIYGNTEPFLDILESYGGVFSDSLPGGQGWIFMNGKKEGLEKDLKPYILSESTSNNQINTKISTNLPITYSQGVAINENISDSQRELLGKYISKLDNLRSFNFLGISGPHKAVLLLAIFYLVKIKEISSQKIYFTELLEKQYNTYWKQLFGNDPTLGAAYPFAHLNKDSILQHKLIRPLLDYDIMWNRQTLRKYIPYTMMEKQLFSLLKDKECNTVLGDFLINHYCKLYKKHNAVNGSTKSLSHKDRFQKYLETTPNDRGNLISASSIAVYIGALCGKYFMSKIESIDPSGDIYNVTDINALTNIALDIEEDVRNKRTSPSNRTAIKLYIKYLTQYFATNEAKN